MAFDHSEFKDVTLRDGCIAPDFGAYALAACYLDISFDDNQYADHVLPCHSCQQDFISNEICEVYAS